jgi:hypothetical protein
MKKQHPIFLTELDLQLLKDRALKGDLDAWRMLAKLKTMRCQSGTRQDTGEVGRIYFPNKQGENQ